MFPSKSYCYARYKKILGFSFQASLIHFLVSDRGDKPKYITQESKSKNFEKKSNFSFIYPANFVSNFKEWRLCKA